MAAGQMSSAAGFWLDNAAGTLTDISDDVTSVSLSGGNGLVEITGLGESRRSEQRDLTPVGEVQVTYKLNSTTQAIFVPLLNGTSVNKTVQVLLMSGVYVNGEAAVGAVQHSVPIGLQTGTCTLRAADSSGLFNKTSVALS